MINTAKVAILKGDGTAISQEMEIPALEDPTPAGYVPTTEERLAALEAAMLSMMGVVPNV